MTKIDGWSVEKITSYDQLIKKSGLIDTLPYECGWYYDSPIGGPSWNAGYKIDEKEGSKRFNKSIKEYSLWYVGGSIIKVDSKGEAYISGSEGEEFLPHEETKYILQKLPIGIKKKIGIGVEQKRKETPKSLEHQRRREISKEFQEANKSNYDKYEGPKRTKEEKKQKYAMVESYNKLVSKELTDKLGMKVLVEFLPDDERYHWKISIRNIIVSIKDKRFLFKSEAPNLDGKPVLSSNSKKDLFIILGKSREKYNKVYNEMSNTLQKYKLEISKKLLHDRKMNLGRVKLRAEYARGREYETTEDRLKYSTITEKENYFPY